MAARASAEQWRSRVEAWVTSGKTAKAFSATEGLDPRQLTYWKWKLGKATQEQEGARETRPAFVPARVVREAATPLSVGIDVTFSNGVVMRVPAGFKAGLLAKLIEAVGALSC